MVNVQPHIEALAAVADDWRDSDYPPRREAINKTVSAPNRWTEPAVDHAVDRWMERLTLDALDRWLGDDRPLDRSSVIGVIHGEEGPLAGIREAVAAWGLGFDYVGAVPESSPALLPLLGADIQERYSEAKITFETRATVFSRADAVLATPGEQSTQAIHEACEDNGVSADRRLVRQSVYSIGIIDGHESEDEMERLAEDMLLFEGAGRGRLAILWAPVDHRPDPYLEAMARFRGLFPAHEDTPGTLQMQQAFLDARDNPHAYAEGLEFLVSRGEPEPQRAGHIRWSEYDELGDVEKWIAEEGENLYAVIARPHLHDQLPDHWPVRSPGGVHVPPLDDEEGRAIVQFLQALGET